MSDNHYYEKIRRPSETKIKQLLEQFNMDSTEEEVKNITKEFDANLNVFDLINTMDDYKPEVQHARKGYRFPSKEENKHNAWYVKCEIKGTPGGKLDGRKVVLKDNVSLAGVAMLNGCQYLEGYHPEVDATIVTRLLDEGAVIVGKAHCENLCLSGNSITNCKTQVHNPHNYAHTSGGSSSGTGALVGSGEVELGIGGDQGGSIRIPSSWCGCYGMKPTHGLVPYTGVMPIEISLDHVGPITTNVTDNALMLEVIAGPDGLDPRQYVHEGQYGNYLKNLKDGVKGMKIGVLKQGFGTPSSEKEVDECVRSAVDHFKTLGATVEEVDIPEHSMGHLAFFGICSEGFYSTSMVGNSSGQGYRGFYQNTLIQQQARWRTKPDQLSDTCKLFTLLSEYLKSEFDGTMYGKCQNISRKVTEAYNKHFEKYDVIVMPTLPYTAPELKKMDVSYSDYMSTCFGMIANTATFDVTGHPAMTLPVGKKGVLPIGMMIVSKKYNEAQIYQAAYAWEQSKDWRQ